MGVTQGVQASAPSKERSDYPKLGSRAINQKNRKLFPDRTPRDAPRKRLSPFENKNQPIKRGLNQVTSNRRRWITYN